MQTVISFPEEKINNTKPPTERDIKIFEYLKAGNKINHITAMQLFKTTGLRDAVYRLRKANYDVKGQTIFYKTESGENKKYREYFVSQ